MESFFQPINGRVIFFKEIHLFDFLEILHPAISALFTGDNFILLIMDPPLTSGVTITFFSIVTERQHYNTVLLVIRTIIAVLRDPPVKMSPPYLYFVSRISAETLWLGDTWFFLYIRLYIATCSNCCFLKFLESRTARWHILNLNLTTRVPPKCTFLATNLNCKYVLRFFKCFFCGNCRYHAYVFRWMSGRFRSLQFASNNDLKNFFFYVHKYL